MSVIHFSQRTKGAIVWAGLALALAFFYLVWPIVTPFIWAAVTAYILNALVNLAVRRVGGPRPLWVVLIYFGLVIGIIWGLTALVPGLADQVQQISKDMPAYTKQVADALQSANIDLGRGRVTQEQITEAARNGLSEVLGTLGERAPELARSIFEGVLHLLIYLIATFSILLGIPRTVSNFRSLFTPAALDELDPWFMRINHTLISYLRGQLFLVAVVSVATYIGLSLLGVQYALALAIMSGLVETIPYIGPYAAGGIAVLVALTQVEPNNFGWSPVGLGVAVALMYTVIRQTEDNVVMPFVIGRTVELHPLTVLFVVLAGASISGVLGLLIAVPVAATIKIVAEFLWEKIREPSPPETEVLIEVEPPGPASGAPETVRLEQVTSAPVTKAAPRADSPAGDPA